MTDTILNQAAKIVLDSAKTQIIAAVTVVTGDATRKATAAQVMALTSYKAFTAANAAIPAAEIAAYLNIDETGLKKLKQYVSRAKKLYDNQGASYIDSEGNNALIDNDAIMGDTPPSLTTVYKQYNAHVKAVQDAKDAANEAKAIELKAAQAYVDSVDAASLPSGVTNADELLAVARGDIIANRESDYTSALDLGKLILAENAARDVQASRISDLLIAGQAMVAELAGYDCDSANDVLATVSELIVQVAQSQSQADETEVSQAA